MNLHDLLSTDDVLRDPANSFGEPSEALCNWVKWLLPPGGHTLEIGLSSLSILAARRSRLHHCVVQDAAVTDRLSAFLQAQKLEADALRPLTVAEATIAALDTGSIDAVFLSCPAAFPAYYAHCHEALRLLRPGGRLVVRGMGVWTVEQFKNHLRLDPRFNAYTAVAPDAIVVQKAAETQNVEWNRQPYVVANSMLVDDRAIAAAQALPVRASMETFSTAVEAAQAARAQLARSAHVRKLGLVGYYGFGNYGDELFRIAFEQGLPDFHLPLMNDYPRRPFVAGGRLPRVLRTDGILIGGGDLVIPRFQEWYFSPEFLKRPVFIHGVGVPHGGSSGDPKVVDHLKRFFNNANIRWINVRDIESAAWIREHLQPACPVQVSPDIVCGLDFPARAPAVPARTIALVTRKTGGDPDNFNHLRTFVKRARERGLAVRAVIAGTGLIAQDDYEDFVTRDLPVTELVRCRTIEEVTEAIASADMVVSMKFHGCVVGLMSGLPTFSLLRDDKFSNLYRALGLGTMIMGYNTPTVAEILDIPPAQADRAVLRDLREGARAAMRDLRGAMLAGL